MRTGLRTYSEKWEGNLRMKYIECLMLIAKLRNATDEQDFEEAIVCIENLFNFLEANEHMLGKLPHEEVN